MFYSKLFPHNFFNSMLSMGTVNYATLFSMIYNNFLIQKDGEVAKGDGLAGGWGDLYLFLEFISYYNSFLSELFLLSTELCSKVQANWVWGIPPGNIAVPWVLMCTTLDKAWCSVTEQQCTLQGTPFPSCRHGLFSFVWHRKLLEGVFPPINALAIYQTLVGLQHSKNKKAAFKLEEWQINQLSFHFPSSSFPMLSRYWCHCLQKELIG